MNIIPNPMVNYGYDPYPKWCWCADDDNGGDVVDDDVDEPTEGMTPAPSLLMDRWGACYSSGDQKIYHHGEGSVVGVGGYVDGAVGISVY